MMGVTATLLSLGARLYRSLTTTSKPRQAMWNPFKRSRTITDLATPIPFSELKKRVKIVVIDDDKESFPVDALNESGYTIQWWPSIDSAGLNRLETGSFDIIILDIQGIVAPGLSDTQDGLGVLRRIKDVNESQMVIAFSGQAYKVDAMPFYRVADDVLGKPVTTIKCKEMLDHLIRERVGVAQYWASIRALLQRDGVSEDKIRRLENQIVLRAKKNQVMTTDQITKEVGNLESAANIATLIDGIVTLWHLVS
jgi:DNA-binding response OmpR family regulator